MRAGQLLCQFIRSNSAKLLRSAGTTVGCLKNLMSSKNEPAFHPAQHPPGLRAGLWKHGLGDGSLA